MWEITIAPHTFVEGRNDREPSHYPFDTDLESICDLALPLCLQEASHEKLGGM